MRAAVVDRRLEAIAGPPVASLTTVGSVPTGMGPLQPRTLILAIGPGTGALGWVARFGPAAAGISRCGVQTDTTGAILSAFMTPGEIMQQINAVVNPRPVIVSVRIGDTLVLDVRVNRRTAAFVWGDGFTSDILLVQSTACLQAAAWPRVLTDAEMVAVSRWLARRYGIPL